MIKKGDILYCHKKYAFHKSFKYGDSAIIEKIKHIDEFDIDIVDLKKPGSNKIISFGQNPKNLTIHDYFFTKEEFRKDKIKKLLFKDKNYKCKIFYKELKYLKDILCLKFLKRIKTS